ncbi:MAG: autotransporter-associated beta strand repeat-containing protein, partial [Pirellulales bacterium]|nr:autotransporter-associated beta strand repeat-containing protein [Pirellulales bacterium]
GAIGGDYSLTKAGGGTLTLGGANAYTGNTTISAGTLKLGGAASLASGAVDVAAGATFDVSEVSGGYNLTAGQTLNGDGIVSGDITINGIHAPGYSPGIQIIEGDYNMLGELQIELAGTDPGTGYDQVLLSGSGDYNAMLDGTLTLDWTGFADSSEETQLWIVQNDTDGILSGEFDDYANGSWLGVHDDLEWWIWYGADAASGDLSGGNDVLISAVPEPSTLVLIGIAAIALSARALRRRKPAAPSRR